MRRFRTLSDWWPLLWLLLFASVGGVLFAGHLELKRRTPFWHKYQKVQWGMTEQEVKDILGPPTRDDTWECSMCPTTWAWVEGEQEIVVDFYPDGRGDAVTRKAFRPKSVAERVRDFFRSR